jgi:hypothetical protein
MNFYPVIIHCPTICPAAEVTLVYNEARTFIYSAMIANHAQEFCSRGRSCYANAISCSVGQYCIRELWKATPRFVTLLMSLRA